MKLTEEQKRAAAMYWTFIMTGEIQAQGFQSKVVPFMANMEIIHRKNYIQALTQKNSQWTTEFMENLFELLSFADTSTTLSLNIQPQGILKQALQMSEIADCVFPIGTLEMSFDTIGNLRIGSELYTAQQILNQEEFILSQIFSAIHL